MTHLLGNWRLLPQRIALHEASATAVIADVHLGYGTARQRQGDAVPARPVVDEMRPLLEAAKAVELRRLLVAGDLFEAGYDAELCRQFLECLSLAQIEFAGLIPGNHDRGIEQAPPSLPIFPDGCDVAGWRITHGDRGSPDDRAIMGHWHPALRVRGRKLPCFLASGLKLILPAFSLDAAGVDVQKDARWRGWDCLAIDNEKVMSAKKLA